MKFKIQRTKEIPLDYTDLFFGVLITTVMPHQQRVDVYLQDSNQVRMIKIASIIDKGISMVTCRERALSFLNNEDFCFAHYRDLINEEK